MRRRSSLFAALAGCLTACSTDAHLEQATTSFVGATTTAPATASDVSTGTPNAAPSASEPTGALGSFVSKLPAVLPGRTDGCAEGMVRVEGEYCAAVVQHCLQHHAEVEKSGHNKNVSERCLRYEAPTRCVVKARRKMSFCVDRFEYPNQVGELPRVLTQWTEARELCARQGKRLCTEDEHNFACEGPEAKPYVYGFTRDDTICNIDKPYRFPDHSRTMLRYDDCALAPWCKAELDRLDQRHRIGELASCVSWVGAYDLNGNVNEWVERPQQKPPNRSGLKGGWWGPVRARCRPTVTFHKENDYGYEAGFRCCADAR